MAATSDSPTTILELHRLKRPNETINVDLAVYAFKTKDTPIFIIYKGPTSKYYDEHIYNSIEKRTEETPLNKKKTRKVHKLFLDTAMTEGVVVRRAHPS